MPAKQTHPQYKLRLPPELKARIENAAGANRRSMNAEIVARLERTFVHERLRETMPPSFDDMKDEPDLKSESGIHRLITALEERGFIRRLPNRARALEVKDIQSDRHRGHQGKRDKKS